MTPMSSAAVPGAGAGVGARGGALGRSMGAVWCGVLQQGCEARAGRLGVAAAGSPLTGVA
jgi:hypothetical protein